MNTVKMLNIRSALVLVYVILFIQCNGSYIFQETPPASNTHRLVMMNLELGELYRVSAGISWAMMSEGDPTGTLEQRGAVLSAAKTAWKNEVCDSFAGDEDDRMVKLLCRGAHYTREEARELSKLLDNMSEIYSSVEVCVPEGSWPAAGSNVKSNDGNVCLKGEPDLERLMSRQDLTSQQLHWVWKSWHDTVGPHIKQYYPRLVTLMNQAAINTVEHKNSFTWKEDFFKIRKNKGSENISSIGFNVHLTVGYNDIGETWREELEISNLEDVVQELYDDINPFYVMLHAVVRHVLVKKYGSKIVDPVGPIPAHLLGNMWAQDWSSVAHLLIPKRYNIDLNVQLSKKNWTVNDMVSLAEDMYMSLGLPKMTDKFWTYSKFERNDKNSTQCHGTAANMYDTNDYRILLCAKVNMEDFYVLHHEMGHIEYYMAYKNQPTIFKEGANSAFQEAVGDSIMTGVMVPQHLHRLGLISDEQLLDENIDDVLLLQQALAKIPHLPFALLLDQYRWNIFNGNIKPETYNRDFWYMNRILRGISPPEPRNENYFDAGAKFHVPDNTPYIRYFLSTILQMEMFKGMCELTIFGKVAENKDANIPFPLHRCDIYGSKNAGTKLKEMMSQGVSKHWSESLKILTGKNYITVKPILDYYKPVQKWLKDYIVRHNVTVGW